MTDVRMFWSAPARSFFWPALKAVPLTAALLALAACHSEPPEERVGAVCCGIGFTARIALFAIRGVGCPVVDQLGALRELWSGRSTSGKVATVVKK